MRAHESGPVAARSQDEFLPRRSWLKAFSLVFVPALLGRNLPRSLFAQGAGEKAARVGESVQLHIYIEVKPGKGAELEKLYHSAYVPAIRVQNGFLWSRLLRHYDSNSRYEIDISFKTEKQRAAWAQSKEHQAAWPKIEAVGAKITWQGFDQLA